MKYHNPYEDTEQNYLIPWSKIGVKPPVEDSGEQSGTRKPKRPPMYPPVDLRPDSRFCYPISVPDAWPKPHKDDGLEMLAATNDTKQTVPLAGAPILFTDRNINDGEVIAHAPGSGIFTLLKRGIYVVSFNVTSSANVVACPVDTAIQLEVDGNVVPGSIVEGQLTTPYDSVPMSFQVAFCVTETPVNMSVVSTVAGVSFDNASIIITRVGKGKNCQQPVQVQI